MALTLCNDFWFITPNIARKQIPAGAVNPGVLTREATPNNSTLARAYKVLQRFRFERERRLSNIKSEPLDRDPIVQQ
ncbi:hypothetical protein [Mesorhizobium sp. BHbdii]